MQKCTCCEERTVHLRNTDPSHLIPSICEQFYHLGWVTGTGGSISIRDKKENEDLIYITPSGVHKERILPEHLYVTTLEDEDNVLKGPDATLNLKMSQCTPLFYAAYRLRNAGSVIHTHSTNAVLVTLMLERSGKSVFQITHQEMIKGICVENGYAKYFDTITVPIIENTPDERDLRDSLAAAIAEYPNSHAVLVRRHGVYVWGKNWQQAKSMCECYDYLFGIAVEMMKLGLDPAEVPAASPYKDQAQIFK